MRTRKSLPMGLCVCAVVALSAAVPMAALFGQEAAPAGDKTAAPAGKAPQPALAFSGPYSHKNLSVYLIHGQDQLKGKKIITLAEALEAKKAVVHETGDVNELVVENKSDAYLFIHSGDIVKGGRQDRTLGHDTIVPPNSGKVQIKSFCVESGRWRQRGSEDHARFSASKMSLNSSELKLAAAIDGDQGKVWAKVAEAQNKINANLGTVLAQTDGPTTQPAGQDPTTQPAGGEPAQQAAVAVADVTANASSSSLQLTLESKDLRRGVEDYTKKLAGITKDRKDAIGYAFSINGEFYSADVYASAELFKKLWPKLLDAAAVEAIAEFDKDREFRSSTVEGLAKWMADATDGKKSKRRTSKYAEMEVTDSDGAVQWESINEDDGVTIHKSIVRKKK